MSTDPQQPTNLEDYPLHMIMAIVPPDAVAAVITGLTAALVPQEAIDVAQGVADAERMEDNKESEDDVLVRLGHLFASTEEHTQRDEYIHALKAGQTVVRVKLEDETKKRAIGQVIVDQGGHFINYYGRWTIETLIY